MNLNKYVVPYIVKRDVAIAERGFEKYTIVQNRMFESGFDWVVKDLEGGE